MYKEWYVLHSAFAAGGGDALPLGEDLGEVIVELLVALSELTHLLDIDFFEESGDLDALDDQLDLLVLLYVRNVQRCVILYQLNVLLFDIIKLLGDLFVGRLEERSTESQLDQILSILEPLISLFVRLLRLILHLLLSRDLIVKFFFGFLLLFLQKRAQLVLVLLVELFRINQLELQTSLSIQKLRLGIAVGFTAALQFQLDLFVLLIQLPLILQETFDFHVGQVLLVDKVVVAGLSNSHVSLYQLVLRLEVHLCGLVLLGEFGVGEVLL